MARKRRLRKWAPGVASGPVVGARWWDQSVAPAGGTHVEPGGATRGCRKWDQRMGLLGGTLGWITGATTWGPYVGRTIETRVLERRGDRTRACGCELKTSQLNNILDPRMTIITPHGAHA